MPFAPVNGIELYYEVHGSGPAVVFAHGSGVNGIWVLDWETGEKERMLFPPPPKGVRPLAYGIHMLLIRHYSCSLWFNDSPAMVPQLSKKIQPGLKIPGRVGNQAGPVQVET